MTSKAVNRVPYEAESWSLMSTMTFEQICNTSNLFPKWKEWQYVKSNPDYKGSILYKIDVAEKYRNELDAIRKTMLDDVIRAGINTNGEIFYVIEDSDTDYGSMKQRYGKRVSFMDCRLQR